MTARSGNPPAHPLLLIVGILLIAGNLRVPITEVAPVLDMIQDGFGLSATAAGMLTTLPVLAFAVCSPLAALLANARGIERALLIGLVLIAAGVLARSSGTLFALYLGTCLMGGGIAICNVLLPSLVKRDFPDRIATLTCAYAFLMSAMAALGSAIVIPLAETTGQGWQFALGTSAIFTLVSIAVWLPQLRGRTAQSKDAIAVLEAGPVWRFALAWQVSVFFGLNSFVFYAISGWLPVILQNAGYSPEQAGNLHSLLQLTSAFSGLVLVPVVRWVKDQRILALAAAATSVTGLLGFVFMPQWGALWAAIYGFASGACLILGLTFVSLRAGNSQQATALSGMAQTIGYLLAASGPALVGMLHDSFGGWNAALLACASVAGLNAIFGALAGRSIRLGEPRLPARECIQ